MKTILRNTLAVVAGFVAGSIVNMGLIMVGGQVVPPPAGGDVSSMEALAATMHLFEPRPFLFPYLGHALGTLVGALVAALIASTHKVAMAYVVGALFLCGGIANVVMLPAPLWFEVLDLVTAYLPMAWLGARLATRPRAVPVAA